jgi:hypothetical protein
VQKKPRRPPLSGTLQLTSSQWKRLVNELDMLLIDVSPKLPVHSEISILRTAVHQAHQDALRSRQIRRDIAVFKTRPEQASDAKR